MSGSGGLTFALGEAAQWVPWATAPQAEWAVDLMNIGEWACRVNLRAKHLVNGHITGIIRW